MKALHMATFILLVVGGLNWLLFGLIGWEIGSLVGGMESLVARIIYILVGLSAVAVLVTHKKDCKHCAKPGMGAGMPPAGGMGGTTMPQ
jgi:uncharacterized protein